MSNKSKGNDGLLSDLVFDDMEVAEKSPSRNKTSHLSERGNALRQAAGGVSQLKTLLMVDPAVCRMWSGHDRRYDLLSIDDDKCLELVDGIKSAGKQEMPALVRKVENDPNFEYEVIYGARRHWAISWLRENNYPDFKYLIEVRDLTDEECFRLNDMENREKDDVSDFERSVNYNRAKDMFYGGVSSRMADRIGYTNANLSYLLRLADLPVEIQEAFADVRNITVNNGRTLYRLMKRNSQKKLILNNAKEIAKQQLDLKSEGKQVLDSSSVMKRLINIDTRNKTQIKPKIFESENKKASVKVLKTATGYINLTIIRGKETEKTDIKEALERFLSGL